MATKPFYGDPATSAPVFGKYAVLLSGLTSTNPTGTPAGGTAATMGFTLNTTSRTASVSTTATSTTITAATSTFTSADVGETITGTGIPASTTITAVASGTSATISAAATATGTITATIGTATTANWDPVGALDDDNPFDSGEESIEVSTHSAAGLGIYARTFKNQEERISFTALETTLRTLGLLYDTAGLTDTGTVVSGKVKFRDPTKKYKVGIVRHNDSTLERRVSVNYAQIDTISRTGGEKALYTVTMAVYPNSSSELFDYYLGPKA